MGILMFYIGTECFQFSFHHCEGSFIFVVPLVNKVNEEKVKTQ